MRWLGLVFVVACGSPTTPSRVVPAGKVVASNVLRGDYAGSQACSDCHGEIYDRLNAPAQAIRAELEKTPIEWQ